MDCLSVVKLRHAALRPLFERQYFAGLTPEQWRARPHPAVNSIAWLTWHLARSEDFALNRLIAGRPQLFEEGGWRDRLGVPLARVGTGMSDEEVGDFSARVELAVLREYWQTVGERSAAVLEELGPEELETTFTEAVLRQQLLEADALGGLAEDAPLFQTMLAIYTGKTREWVLFQTGLLHHWGHGGEMGVIRSLLGHCGFV
jgi:hypothetical protein